MSIFTKRNITLGVAGVVVVGGIAYFATRPSADIAEDTIDDQALRKEVALAYPGCSESVALEVATFASADSPLSARNLLLAECGDSADTLFSAALLSANAQDIDGFIEYGSQVLGAERLSLGDDDVILMTKSVLIEKSGLITGGTLTNEEQANLLDSGTTLAQETIATYPKQQEGYTLLSLFQLHAGDEEQAIATAELAAAELGDTRFTTLANDIKLSGEDGSTVSPDFNQFLLEE